MACRHIDEANSPPEGNSEQGKLQRTQGTLLPHPDMRAASAALRWNLRLPDLLFQSASLTRLKSATAASTAALARFTPSVTLCRAASKADLALATEALALFRALSVCSKIVWGGCGGGVECVNQ